VVVLDQASGKRRADETGAARDEYALPPEHPVPLSQSTAIIRPSY
jgi:hypothetical protein